MKTAPTALEVLKRSESTSKCIRDREMKEAAAYFRSEYPEDSEYVDLPFRLGEAQEAELEKIREHLRSIGYDV